MTRRIPAAASVVLPDNRITAPNKPAKAGSATVGAQWYDLASIHNLQLATVHAQPVHQQCWDGNFAFNSVGYVTRYTIFVPKLTDQHFMLTCRVYGVSPATGGLVKFTATTAGTTSVVALPAATAWTAGGAALNVSTSFGVNDYETIEIATDGSVYVENIAIEYSDINPGGAYPAADDQIAAGAANAIDGALPLDTSELAADSPLCSEFAQTLDTGITTTSARLRSYSCYGSITSLGFVQVPHRAIVPVYDFGSDVHELTYRIRIRQTGLGTQRYYIQFTGTDGIEDGQHVHESNVAAAPYGYAVVDVPVGVAGVMTEVGGTIALQRSQTLVRGPGAYYGHAWLTVYPDSESGELGLMSFAAWGV